MVRRGSTVRVRQRASKKPCKWVFLLSVQTPARRLTGTRRVHFRTGGRSRAHAASGDHRRGGFQRQKMPANKGSSLPVPTQMRHLFAREGSGHAFRLGNYPEHHRTHEALPGSERFGDRSWGRVPGSSGPLKVSRGTDRQEPRRGMDPRKATTPAITRRARRAARRHSNGFLTASPHGSHSVCPLDSGGGRP
jgi:hypothetical protein